MDYLTVGDFDYEKQTFDQFLFSLSKEEVHRAILKCSDNFWDRHLKEFNALLYALSKLR